MRRTSSILLCGLLLIVSSCASTGGHGRSGSSSSMSVKNPLYPFTVMRQGSVELQQGHYEAALKHFEEAARLEPGNATAYNMIGLCELRLNKPAQSIEAFNKALALIPSFSDARNNRGVAYLALKQYRLAEVDFLAVLADTTYPHRWQVYYNLGMTYLQTGRLVAAEENLRRAANAPVPVFQAVLRLAEVQQKQGKLDAAIATLQAAHLKFPERPEATLDLAKALILAGKKEQANRYLKEVIANSPDSQWAATAKTLLKGK